MSEIGHYAAAAGAFGHWVFCIGTPVHPFNNIDGDTAIPNPLVATATQSPAGLQNLLYNATTNTGLYNYFRVWKAAVRINCQPTNGADGTVCVMSPLTTTSAPPFANVINAQDSPGSVVRVCTQANPTAANTLQKVFDLSAILGLTPSEYGAFSASTYGSYGNLPADTVYVAVTSNTQNNNAYNAVCGFEVKIVYDVEFFQRTDTVLLDA